MEHNGIAAGFVEDALACLRASGRDPAPVIAAAGIGPLAGPVSPQCYSRLWLAIAAAMQDEFLGLGARPMRPGSFALMGHAVLHAGTLERGLRRALRFLNVVLEYPRGRLDTRAGEAVILLEDPDTERGAFAYRTYWLILMGLACWLVGRRIPLRRLDFTCNAPPLRQDYRQFFGAPVRFDQPQSCLQFDAEHLRLPTIRSEAALKSFLSAAPGNILMRYRHDGGLAAQLRARLAAREPGDWPDFLALAGEMGVAPATLRRRLKSDGQSFMAIKDELRLAMAQRLLRETGQGVADVAVRLGYSEPGAFHRAFRSWTGQSPGAFRRNLKDM
ncbi:AraC family transcriptional regulator [Paracoccus salsus]|uniref:AraC family transcriptional regulator n=1 Tax=Paracoccus salsus TaxID=2911061 RepID=UPI001F43FB87|nr:AraC family transcriptional regulator [Paracoccus salsus]MCF3972364.1 AraC family transcriptional regulator [Paracoccus salsus]